MTTKTLPPKLTDGYKANFQLLLTAAENGDLLLVSAIDKSTGEPRALVCAANREAGGTIQPVPLAILCWDDPYKMFHDPTVV